MSTLASDAMPARQRSQRVINKTEKVIQYEEMRQQQQQNHHHHHHHTHNHHAHRGSTNGHEAIHEDGSQLDPQQIQLALQQQDQYPAQNQNGPGQVIHTDAYPGLNEITDAFEAFPQELVRYFTLLKEIDAKCVYTVPYLKAYIKRYLQMPVDHPKRQELLLKIRTLIKELMPSLEEKMHVASIAIDCVTKNVNRIEEAYEEVIQNDEIPESVRVGPLNHPAMIMETKIETLKSAQSQRSESRREALAAKKALNINAPASFQSQDDEDSNATPGASASLTGSKKRKQTGGAGNSNSRKKKAQDDTRSSTPQYQHGHQAHHAHQQASIPANNSQAATVLAATTAVPLPSVQQVKSTSKRLPPQQQVAQSGAVPRSIPATGKAAGNRRGAGYSNADEDNFQEPVYCYCQQVSFGEMVGCDGDDCKREWFHLPCIGLTDPPKGKWYCNDCLAKMKRAPRR